MGAPPEGIGGLLGIEHVTYHRRPWFRPVLDVAGRHQIFGRADDGDLSPWAQSQEKKLEWPGHPGMADGPRPCVTTRSRSSVVGTYSTCLQKICVCPGQPACMMLVGCGPLMVTVRSSSIGSSSVTSLNASILASCDESRRILL